MQKDVRVQARTGGKEVDGCEVEGQKAVAQMQKEARVQALTGDMDADGCEVQG